MGKSEAETSGDEAGGAVRPPRPILFASEPFSVGFRQKFGRKERFAGDFWPFSAVSARAPAGKQRSACVDPETG